MRTYLKKKKKRGKEGSYVEDLSQTQGSPFDATPSRVFLPLRVAPAVTTPHFGWVMGFCPALRLWLDP